MIHPSRQSIRHTLDVRTVKVDSRVKREGELVNT